MNIKLKKDSVIICPNDRKKDIIKELSSNFEYNVKYISKGELISIFSYYYDNKALLYLINKKKKSFDNAKEILENLYFIDNVIDKLNEIGEVNKKIILKFVKELTRPSTGKFIIEDNVHITNKKYAKIGDQKENNLKCHLSFMNNMTNKVLELIEYKKELESKGLLVKNELDRKIFDNKDIFVYGYSTKDGEIKEILINKLGINIKDVDNHYVIEEKQENKHQLINFDTIEEEVSSFFSYVCQQKLLEEKIQKETRKENKLEEGNKKIEPIMNSILLYSYPREYDAILRKYARFYKMPINFESNYMLCDSPLYKEFIELIKYNSYSNALEIIKKYDDEFNVCAKIASLCNEIIYTTKDEKEQIFLLEELSKDIRIKKSDYKEGINIVSSSYRGDKHVFMLGFSLGSYPSIKKDTDFLLDKEKLLFRRNTSKIENLINYEMLENFILNNKNLHISFKEKLGKTKYYKSLLTKKLKLESEETETKTEECEIKKENSQVKENQTETEKVEKRYNEDLAILEVASYKDLKKNYSIDSKYESALEDKKVQYDSFDHSFKEDDIFKNDKEMTISFSLIDDYEHCPFQYFIKRICKTDVFEETFYTNIGTLFHKVLEDSLKKDINKDDYKAEIEKKFTTAKDLFFVNKLFDEILEVIEKNKKFMNKSKFKLVFGEQKMPYRFDQNTNITGSIDKFMIYEDKNEAKNSAIIIVDYKTGNIHFDKREVEFGLSLQLIIYSLMIREYFKKEVLDKETNEKKFVEMYQQVGIYLQKILNNEDDIEEKYKLTGLSVNEGNLLSLLEPFLEGKSEYVEGLTMGKNKYNSSNYLISKKEFVELVDKGKRKIEEALQNIREGKFPINPVYINGDDGTCKYCPLLSVCFKNSSDQRNVKIKKR